MTTLGVSRRELAQRIGKPTRYVVARLNDRAVWDVDDVELLASAVGETDRAFRHYVGNVLEGRLLAIGGEPDTLATLWRDEAIGLELAIHAQRSAKPKRRT